MNPWLLPFLFLLLSGCVSKKHMLREIDQAYSKGYAEAVNVEEAKRADVLVHMEDMWKLRARAAELACDEKLKAAATKRAGKRKSK